MAFSSGTYTLPGAALNTGDTVSATENNTLRNDMASSFNLTWLRNGTAAATANIPMGGFEFTNAAAIGSNSSLLLKSNNGTTAVTIDASQNVGVGVTPSSAFSSGKSIEVGYAGNAFWSNGANDVRMSANVKYNLYAANGAASTYVQGAGTHLWSTAASGTAGNAITFTQAMTLDASGNLLVGTTSSAKGSSGSIFSAGSAQENIRLNGTNPQTFVTFNLSGSTVGSISASGSTTTYATSSDYRLKENIEPMIGALAKVAQLKPVTYIWKSDGSASQGFIAHELQEVVPECVVGEKDAVDADGNAKYQGIDTSFLVATLTAAIQEQQSLIQSLTDRLTALEGAAK